MSRASRVGVKCRVIVSVLVLAVLAALAGCGSSSTVPADTPPPHADALVVTVIEHDYTVTPQVNRTVFARTLTDAAAIAATQAALLSIPLEVPGALYNCPAGAHHYHSYDLRFTEGGTLVEHATSDAMGCQVWYITTARGNVTRLATPSSFWDQLHQATGAPLPFAFQPATPTPVGTTTPLP